MARILVVDDEPGVREMLTDALTMQGHTVSPAGDGFEALASLRADSFDLVVSDINMPKVDGYQLLERMRGLGDSTPVILLTARGEKADLARGFRTGADDYVTKPFGTAELLALRPGCPMGTAAHVIDDETEFRNPNVVKVVLDAAGYAMYFSRAPIPYPRDAFTQNLDLPANMPVYRHIGIYAYRASFLQAYSKLDPAPIEQSEALEQLRAMWHGYKISVAITEKAPATGVDTQQDLDLVRSLFLAS